MLSHIPAYAAVPHGIHQSDKLPLLSQNRLLTTKANQSTTNEQRVSMYCDQTLAVESQLLPRLCFGRNGSPLYTQAPPPTTCTA